MNEYYVGRYSYLRWLVDSNDMRRIKNITFDKYDL